MAKTPRNLRQVGSPEGNVSIYIEDYVLTYLKGEYNTEAAILIGESCYEESAIIVFVRGVISCPQLYWREEGMEMTVRTWNYIYREREHLYPGQEIVGWYLPLPSKEETMLVSVGEFQGRHFPGADKVFFYLDAKRGDEAFYMRDGNVFKRQSGYYVFYEKNAAMREYMMALREERQLEADLYKEVHDKPREQMRYREYIHAELEKRSNHEGIASYIVGIASLVAIVALVFGIVSGYRDLNGLDSLFAAVEDVLQLNLTDEEENEAESIVAGNPPDTDASESEPEEDVDTSGKENDDSEGDFADSSEGDSSIIEGTQFDEDVDEAATEIAMALAQGYYVVKQGEGLSEICKKLYGTDELLGTICEINDIENPDTIFPGQIIYLP